MSTDESELNSYLVAWRSAIERLKSGQTVAQMTVSGCTFSFESPSKLIKFFDERIARLQGKKLGPSGNGARITNGSDPREVGTQTGG